MCLCVNVLLCGFDYVCVYVLVYEFLLFGNVMCMCVCMCICVLFSVCMCMCVFVFVCV